MEFEMFEVNKWRPRSKPPRPESMEAADALRANWPDIESDEVD